jgi:hypothetical protein
MIYIIHRANFSYTASTLTCRTFHCMHDGNDSHIKLEHQATSDSYASHLVLV